jgi:hypothetical protein
MAYNFNGTNQYLSGSGAPVFTPPFTLSARFNTTVNNVSQIFGALVNTANLDRHNFFVASAGGISASTTRADGTLNGVTGTSNNATVVTTGQWHHAAGVYRSTTNRQIYFNSISGTANTTSLPVTVVNMQIGARIAPGVTLVPFSGNIADFGVWDIDLSDGEIASLSKGFSCHKIRPTSLVFHAPLVRVIQDTVGNLVLTNINTATVSNQPRIYL